MFNVFAYHIAGLESNLYAKGEQYCNLGPYFVL